MSFLDASALFPAPTSVEAHIQYLQSLTASQQREIEQLNAQLQTANQYVRQFFLTHTYLCEPSLRASVCVSPCLLLVPTRLLGDQLPCPA